MNKNNKKLFLYVFIVLLLGGIYYFSTIQKKSGTINVALTDFAVTDTASLTKIFLADRMGKTITLQKNSKGVWMINNSIAFKERVDILLQTLKLVEVKQPVGSKAKDYYIKELATSATKVELYAGSNKVKTYYVGGSTPDNLGTVMMLEGSSEPFITHIPGFNGFLNTRYFTEEIEWKSRVINVINPLDIKEVSVEAPDNVAKSFNIQKKGTEFLMFSSQKAGFPIAPPKAKELFVGICNLDFDDFVKPNQLNIDSVLKTKPVLIYTITLTNGTVLPSLQLFAKKPEKSTKYIDEFGNDGDQYIGNVSSNPKELFYIQRFVLKKVLHNSEYYL